MYLKKNLCVFLTQKNILDILDNIKIMKFNFCKFSKANLVDCYIR